MRIVIYFILIFGFIKPSCAQDYVFVVSVKGNVEFVADNIRTSVKDNSPYSEKDGLFILKDKNSNLYLRIHTDQKKDVYDLLTFFIILKTFLSN